MRSRSAAGRPYGFSMASSFTSPVAVGTWYGSIARISGRTSAAARAAAPAGASCIFTAPPFRRGARVSWRPGPVRTDAIFRAACVRLQAFTMRERARDATEYACGVWGDRQDARALLEIV